MSRQVEWCRVYLVLDHTLPYCHVVKKEEKLTHIFMIGDCGQGMTPCTIFDSREDWMFGCQVIRVLVFLKGSRFKDMEIWQFFDIFLTFLNLNSNV